jgi:predicted mannosyl-3-phosphoglycerate phosphatase (HAD superfamily)
MLNLSFDLQPETEQKFIRIMEQYSDKEEFFQDIIRYQIDELKNSIHNIEIDLKELEQKHCLSSEEFYRKFTNGDLGDEEEYILWSGIYEMQSANKKKLTELE